MNPKKYDDDQNLDTFYPLPNQPNSNLASPITPPLSSQSASDFCSIFFVAC